MRTAKNKKVHEAAPELEAAANKLLSHLEWTYGVKGEAGFILKAGKDGSIRELMDVMGLHVLPPREED